MEKDELGFFFLDYSRYIYVEVLLTLMITLETGIRQVYRTYKPNDIVPYPLNEECIVNFELALVMPASMKHFYAYLETLVDFREPLIVFGLHSDIVEYNQMIDDGEDEADIHSKAVEIFEEYIIEDCKWQLSSDMDTEIV